MAIQSKHYRLKIKLLLNFMGIKLQSVKAGTYTYIYVPGLRDPISFNSNFFNLFIMYIILHCYTYMYICKYSNIFKHYIEKSKFLFTTYRLSRRLGDNIRRCWRLVYYINDFLSIFKNGTTACTLITIYVVYTLRWLKTNQYQ